MELVIPARIGAAARDRVRRYHLGHAAGITLALLGVAYMMWSAYSPPWALYLKDHWGNYFYAPPALLILTAVILISLRERTQARLLPEDLRQAVPGATFRGLRKLDS
jgi:hypothetical protein